MKRIIILISLISQFIFIKAGEVNILDFGAVPDSITCNTEAIQKAIDECSRQGGGKVIIPAGVFLTQTIRMKDNIHLYFETGATLLSKPRTNVDEPSIVVLAQDCKNVTISGSGIIDGQGPAMWRRKPESELSQGIINSKKFGWKQVNHYHHVMPHLCNLIRLYNCENAIVEGLMLKNAERGTLQVVECNWVHVNDVIIKNSLCGPCEGLRISSSSNVTVSGCIIYTADDALVLKSTKVDKPCRNITVTNCILTSLSSAFKIGTETYCAFENIVFSNSILTRSTPDDPYVQEGLDTVDPDHWGDALAAHTGISLSSVDGAHVRGVTISNIVMDGIRGPIFIRLANRGRVEGELVPNSTPGKMKDVIISNVVAYGAAHASSITGIPGHMVDNVTLSEISIQTKGSGTKEMASKILGENEKGYPSSIMWGQPHVSGLFVRHVNGLDISNMKIFLDAPDERPLMNFDDVNGLYIDRLVSDENSIGSAVITMKDVRDVKLEDLQLPALSEKLISFSGEKTARVIIESYRKDIAKMISVSSDVKPESIIRK